MDSKFSLGDTARSGDKKPDPLRTLGEKKNHEEKFTFSAQTSHALIYSLRCPASSIEDLLQEVYDFVMTTRFQSDALEQRYGQYLLMSGRRFLVSLRNVVRVVRKILKL